MRWCRRATDRLKTDDELAKEQREELQKLEAARQARMRGETVQAAPAKGKQPVSDRVAKHILRRAVPPLNDEAILLVLYRRAGAQQA